MEAVRGKEQYRLQLESRLAIYTQKTELYQLNINNRVVHNVFTHPNVNENSARTTFKSMMGNKANGEIEINK